VGNGADRDYGSGTKESWRNTVWNTLAGHADRARPVIYLAGPQDNDRLAALRHGFGRDRLIAVDACADNIDAVVKGRHRGLGIDARLEDVCWAWPDNFPVGAVVADFCGGITKAALAFALALTRPAFDGAVVAVNLLRGRDPLAEDDRLEYDASVVAYARTLSSLIAYIQKYKRDLNTKILGMIHASAQARVRDTSRKSLRGMRRFMEKLVARKLKTFPPWVNICRIHDDIMDLADHLIAADELSRARRMLGVLWNFGVPAWPLSPLMSYRSGRQTFDSVVVKIFGPQETAKSGAEVIGEALGKIRCDVAAPAARLEEMGYDAHSAAIGRLRQRIIAVRAVGTRIAGDPGPLLA
jgi:hypothetical protein